MSLTDRTNERILLSQHAPLVIRVELGVEYDSYPAELEVDVDSDSGYQPSNWVDILWTDHEHDSERIKLTYEEAGLLHDRLGLILGRTPTNPTNEGEPA